MKVKSLSHIRLFATPWTVAHQAPPSMGFSRQEYWSGLPFPSPYSINSYIQFSSVQSLSCAQLFATPWSTARQDFQSITNSQSLLKLMSIQSVTPSNHLSSVILFSSCLQSFPASGSFPTSQLLLSGGQSIGTSASTSVFPMNVQY